MRTVATSTLGRKQLLQWIAEDPSTRNPTSIARALGIRQTSVRDWTLGNSRPDLDRRPALERLTDGRVQQDAWLTAKEKRARLKLAAIEPMVPRTGTG